MKLNELVYDLREVLRQYTDDSEISDSYIVYQYNVKRAKYLRQDLNNFQRTVDTTITQTFCLALEEVPLEMCNTNYSCDTIMRTVKPLPKPLELHTKTAITSVKSVNRIDVPFNIITKEKAAYQGYSPFNKAIYVFLDDDRRLYFISNSETVKLLECVTITGIFEDPIDLKNYQNCCGCPDATPCFDDESEYPLQAHHVDNIRMEIIKLLVDRENNIKEDKDNDDNDNN